MSKDKFYYYLRSVLNFLFFKNKKCVFFYDLGLISFNEIALIRYMNKECPNYKLFFYTNRKKEAQKLLPDSVKIVSGKIGFLYQLISKFVFVEQNCHKWICKSIKKQIVIQLWHGLPVKKVGFLNNKSRVLKYSDLYSYVLAPSEYGWQIMKECFCYLEQQKLILGSPRNDDLFVDDNISDNIKKRYSKKYILWMPTFRNNYISLAKTKKIFPLVNENNISELDDLLSGTDYKLVIKLHSLNQKYKWFHVEYKNIMFITNDDLYEDGILPYNLIGCSSALITDYSSVAIDYLYLKKPIMFTIDDIDEFSDKRGLLRTYDEIRKVGDSVSNIYELVDKIYNLKSLKSEYDEIQKVISKEFNCFQDDKNCERICELIINDEL